MSAAILDASALLAMLLDEPGGERVRSVLAEAAITTVNWTEVVTHYARNGASSSDIHHVLHDLAVERVPFDEELAYEAGLLVSVTRHAGLSLGDRACLALARLRGVDALTADRAWAAVARSTGVKIEIIR